MKFLLLVLLMNGSDIEVPNKVLEQFSKRTTHAEDIQWTKLKAGYKVTYFELGRNKVMYFGPLGFVGKEIIYYEDEIPQSFDRDLMSSCVNSELAWSGYLHRGTHVPYKTNQKNAYEAVIRCDDELIIHKYKLDNYNNIVKYKLQNRPASKAEKVLKRM
ncbi:MAG: hypothetical protein MRY83_18035 [Flavobacteriales bacterium]|nr:hypothetical protein [Flavobacteriales bacterium]